MPLTVQQRKRVEEFAISHGVDPSELVRVAEEESGNGATPSAADGDAGAQSSGGRPVFERMLIGAFPFITVRELRENWLGLTARLKDDHLTCGEFSSKYGGATGADPGLPEVEE